MSEGRARLSEGERAAIVRRTTCADMLDEARAALVAAEARAKALADAADRFDQFLEHELVMYSDEDSPGSLMDTEMRHTFDDRLDAFHVAVDAFRAATEPQP